MNKALSFLLPAIAVFSMATAAYTIVVDKIVATVDDEVILRSDLMREVGPLMNSLRSSVSSDAEFQAQMEQALDDVLDQAIEGKILYKEALLLGAQIDERVIDDKVKEIQGQYDSYDAFLKVLNDAGETMSDFRQQVRKQILAISLAMSKRKEFEQQAVITETDMRQYYQDHMDEFSRPERAQVRRIFLTADAGDNAGRAKVKAQLEALRDEVRQGASFADLAKAHSKGPAAEEGGLIGWVKRGDLVPVLEDAVFAANEGEMTEIVETEFGLTLLLIETREEAGTADYEEMRTEIEPLLRFKYAEQRYKKWIADLRSHSRVQTYI